MTLSVYGAPHGDEAVHDMQALMDTFQAHDVIFLEGVGHNSQQRDVVWDVSARNKSTLTDDEAEQFGTYGQRKLAALYNKISQCSLPMYQVMVATLSKRS